MLPLRATSLNQLSGQRLDAFELVRMLGAGAMGAVYLARDRILRREVALKLLAKSSDDSDGEHQRRFLREARAAARLIHPNVVQIFQIGETDDVRYIAMEYVPGMTAAQMARQQGGRLPEELCIWKMREAAAALQLADSLGICHQDIKPANLLLTATGALKIADFGLAAQVEGGDSIGAAAVKQIQGTPFYMSPEQWRNRDVGTATDIYSLGCTFYHLLVGQPPYGRLDMVSCFRAHCTAPVPDPRKPMPDMSPLFADLLQRCLAKRPADRPRAEDIITVLDEAARLRYGVRPSSPFIRIPHEIPPRPARLAEGSADALTSPSATPQHGASSGSLVPETITISAHDIELEPPTYRDLFALRGYPFSDLRQPALYWDAGPYAWALRTLAMKLTSGSRQAMLLGPPGSGRTFLCDMLPHRSPRLHVFRVEPRLMFGGRLLLSLCRQHGLDMSPSASMRFLAQAFLSHVLPDASPETIAVLVIDSVDPDDAELLADLDLTLRSPLSTQLAVVLVGAEDLHERLAERGAPPSLHPTAAPVLLPGMTLPEMADYIDFRMTTIGGSECGLALDPATRQLLHARSGGSPGLINTYCHNALTIAALQGERALRFETFRLAMKARTYLTPETAQALLDRERGAAP